MHMYVYISISASLSICTQRKSATHIHMCTRTDLLCLSTCFLTYRLKLVPI